MIRFKPVFKKILKFKEILFYSYKILKFKKKKWKNLITFYKQQDFSKKFQKYKLIDQNLLLINLYSNKYSDYRNEYKHYFHYLKNFQVFYFNILKQKITFLKKKRKNLILNFFENRIDFILYRCKFCLTIRSIRKLIFQNYICLNNRKIIIQSTVLAFGNSVSFIFYFKKYKTNLIHCLKWPLPIYNTIINYNIKKILYLGNLNEIDFFSLFPYYLKLIRIFFSFYNSNGRVIGC